MITRPKGKVIYLRTNGYKFYEVVTCYEKILWNIMFYQKMVNFEIRKYDAFYIVEHENKSKMGMNGGL